MQLDKGNGTTEQLHLALMQEANVQHYNFGPANHVKVIDKPGEGDQEFFVKVKDIRDLCVLITWTGLSCSFISEVPNLTHVV